MSTARVTLVRPKRAYPDRSKKKAESDASRGGEKRTTGAPRVAESRAPTRTAESVKNPDGKDGNNYPSIEGVIIIPPSLPAAREKEVGEVERLLASALALEPGQRKELLARLALDRRADKPEDRDLDMWALGVQEALVALQGDEAGQAHVLAVVRRALASSANWEPVADFMSAAGLSSLEVVRKRAVYAMLADLLVRYASSVSRKVGAPLTAKFVANCAQHVGAVFENAFPGYVAAGLAPLVAQRLTGPR